MTPKPFTHRDAVPYRPVDWTGEYPPAFPAGGVPNHVAIVMDGNGRWANRRGLSRTEGQTASPRTVGKEFANVVVRLLKAVDNIANVKILG